MMMIAQFFPETYPICIKKSQGAVMEVTVRPVNVPCSLCNLDFLEISKP